mmetsp:Transcript_6762/g.10720  ORF Transcript_6762/g.10720 Transcript_6762/m.10720 type:complete len:203 (-) Transcript_6762:130-738(-)
MHVRNGSRRSLLSWGSLWAVLPLGTSVSRGSLASRRARLPHGALLPQGTRLSVLTSNTSRSCLARSTILSCRSCRALSTGITGGTRSTVCSSVARGAGSSILTCGARRSSGPRLFNLLHQILDIHIDTSNVPNEFVVPGSLHSLRPHQVVLNVLQVPVLVPSGLRLEFIPVRQLHADLTGLDRLAADYDHGGHGSKRQNHCN